MGFFNVRIFHNDVFPYMCVFIYIQYPTKKLLIPLKRRRRQEPPDLAWKMKALYYRVLELRINSSSSLKFLLLIYAPRLIQVVEDHRQKRKFNAHLCKSNCTFRWVSVYIEIKQARKISDPGQQRRRFSKVHTLCTPSSQPCK